MYRYRGRASHVRSGKDRNADRRRQVPISRACFDDDQVHVILRARASYQGLRLSRTFRSYAKTERSHTTLKFYRAIRVATNKRLHPHHIFKLRKCRQDVVKQTHICMLRYLISMQIRVLTSWVQRRRQPYNTKSNKVRIVRTPGGELRYLHIKKKGTAPKCGDCGMKLSGVCPCLRLRKYTNSI